MIDLYSKFSELNRNIKDFQSPVDTSGAIKAYYGVSVDGNFMISLGSYYLILALVMPNVSVIRNEELASIKLGSPEEIIAVILLIVILLAVGIMINRKTDNIFK